MQGALYFPYIGVPKTAWWTRTMLYWDNVATIEVISLKTDRIPSL
jgi:hypothetical protein